MSFITFQAQIAATASAHLAAAFARRSIGLGVGDGALTSCSFLSVFRARLTSSA